LKQQIAKEKITKHGECFMSKYFDWLFSVTAVNEQQNAASNHSYSLLK